MADPRTSPKAGASDAGRQGNRLLLYIHVPVHQGRNGELLIEPQAANGLRLWAENFSRVTVMQPLKPGTSDPGGLCPVSDIPGAERITFDPLPMAYRPDQFMRRFPATQRRIRDNIARADYLCFSLGGLWGDWGAVSSIMARRMNRPYSVWADRVESQVVKHLGQSAGGRAGLRARLNWRPMAVLEKWVIRRAALGLFHGRETYDHYAPLCRQPQLVHDIHVAEADHLDAGDLRRKQQQAAGGPLRIVYVGRAVPMKGPFDWIETLRGLARTGVDFHATWLGDGPLLDDMRSAIDAAGLSGRVALPGFVQDRQAVLDALRQAHVMLFCHKTPESPRCLIEALISATPLVGYDGAFAADLVSRHQGGELVPLGDTESLTRVLADLCRDRVRLARLMERALRDAAGFSDSAVFTHRSRLIHEYLRA